MRTMGDKMPEEAGQAERRVTAETGLRLTRPVVLVGMMGCGKTAVGTALANRLNVPFRDTDEALVSAARMTIQEIFDRDGEAFFRDRESEVLRRLLEQGPGILSTGGGAFLRPENRDVIGQVGRVGLAEGGRRTALVAGEAPHHAPAFDDRRSESDLAGPAGRAYAVLLQRPA